MKKRKRFAILFPVLILGIALLFSACGSSQEEAAEGSGAEGQYEETTSDAAAEETASEDPYSGVTTLQPAEVEDFAMKVRQAYLDEDWSTISEMIEYPITLNEETIDSAKEFQAFMKDKKIDGSSRKAMEDETCRNMFTNFQGICMGDGDIWFLDVHFDGEEQTDEPLLKIIAFQGIQ